MGLLGNSWRRLVRTRAATRGLAGAFGLVAALGLAACSSPDRTWHEKVTVRLDTPWGERVGSTVTRMSYEQKSKLETWPTGNVHAIWRSGEAVVVDVRPDAPEGEPRYLFVLTPPPIFGPSS